MKDKLTGKKRSKISYRVLRLSLISVMAVIAISQLYSAFSTSSACENMYKNEIHSLTDAYTNSLTTMSDTIAMQIESVALNEIVNNPTSTEELNNELKKLATATYFNEFAVAEPSGISSEGGSVSGEKFFTEAKAGKTYISSPTLHNNSSITTVSTPMKDGRVLYGSLNSAMLSNGLDASTLGEEGRVVVLDKAGTIIASSSSELINSMESCLVDTHELYDLASEMVAGNSDYMWVESNGHKFCTFYEPIEHTDWSIAVLGNYDETETLIARNFSIGIAIGVVLMFLASIISISVANKISNPINIVLKRLEKLAVGDISSPVEVQNTNDETELLMEALKDAVESLQKYLNSIASTCEKMAIGNFGSADNVRYDGDFSKIGTSFDGIRETLGRIIKDIGLSVDGVSAGANQMSESSQLLAQGAVEQASAIDQLNSSIENFSVQIRKNADNAEEVRRLSVESAEKMSVQEVSVQNLVEAMNDIKEKSAQVENIVKTIDDISFQTKILALNASVEAARAGEAGKGFAVVAEEVRALAAKSAEAVQSTSQLIASTIVSVDNGASAVSSTAEMTKEVSAISHRINALITEIDEETDRQTVTIGQISTGISQIADVVQTNSATAEENSASSEELSAQATTLKDLTSSLNY